MLFKPEHVAKIQNGTKTATRRLWKRNMVRVGRIYKAKTKMLSKECFAYIKVIKLYKQKLKDMTMDDVRKEGYDNLEDFKDIWIYINGNWNSEDEPTVIEFHTVDKNTVVEL